MAQHIANSPIDTADGDERGPRKAIRLSRLEAKALSNHKSQQRILGKEAHSTLNLIAKRDELVLRQIRL